MTPMLRACAAVLTFAAVALASPLAPWPLAPAPAWSAGTLDPSGAVIQPGAPVEEGERPAPSANDAAPPLRADANEDGVTDSLETLLDQAEPGEKLDVIVVFEGPGAHGRWRSAAARSRAAVGDFELTREFSLIDGFQASMTAAQIRALSQVPGLLRIQENATVSAFDTYANDDTGASFARGAYGVDGSSATVCVLDTGINPNHEQFDSKGLGEADFRDFTPNARTTPYDDHGHGSHVAGSIAGDGQGSSSLADDAIGVAPAARLRVGKVLDANGQGSESQVIQGVEWCAGLSDVDIVSMSLGGPTTDGNDAISLAVNCAADPAFSTSCGPVGGNPKIVAVAAGNSGAQPGTIGAPGVARNAITVGSFAEWSGDPARVWQDDGVYLNPFSSRGPVTDGSGNFRWHKPDIAAVGSRVLSAYINDATNPSPTAYASASGTSMATPLVSGVVALMLDARDSLRHADAGGLPHQKVRAILEATAVDRGGAGMDDEYGHGLVDAFAAVAEVGNALSYAPTAYPGYAWLPGESVANSGTWAHPFEVAAGDVGYPVAGTMTIPGQLKCAYMFFGSCLSWYWSPDLELVVEQFSGGSWSQVTADTTGSPEVTRSECPATGECGGVGRVEVVHFIPDVAGSYRFVVYPSAGDPNNGKGGTFDFEVSMGAAAGTTVNEAPTASVASPADGTRVVQGTAITFSGSASDAEDGDISGSLAWSSSIDGAIGSGDTFPISTLSMGIHTVTASVTDSGGKSGSDSITVTVTDENDNLPPTAGFSVSVSELSASFTDGSTDSDGTITGWSWDFGDGATSTTQNPTHAYSAEGTYSVTLTVTDDDGATDSHTQSVTVEENDAPVAAFSVDRNPCGSDFFPNECQFTDESSDADGTIQSWQWDFGGGTVTGGIACCPGHTMQVEFPADGPNPETVSLTVTDDDGATHTKSMEVYLSHPATNAAPTASFTYSATDLSVDFTDQSSDSDGSIASRSWTFGDGATATGATPSHTYAAAGTYTVSLTVTDDDGATDSASQNVTVSEPPPPNDSPTAQFTFTVSGLTVDFTDASTDGDGTIAGWSWAFGDGASSTAQNPQHSYAAGGTYTVSLTVTDDDGATGTTSQSVSVTAPNAAPTASFVFNCADLACDFDATGSSDSDGSIASYAWTFGDGSSGSGATPSHAYAAGGTYTVSLTVTDDDGATGTTSQNLTVSEPAAQITLSASGEKVKGQHTIHLGWSGATSTSVDVRRNGGILTTTENDGEHTDSTGNRGSGSYSYELCEAGTSTCSDPVSVVF